jgi:hypothetical protein
MRGRSAPNFRFPIGEVAESIRGRRPYPGNNICRAFAGKCLGNGFPAVHGRAIHIDLPTERRPVRPRRRVVSYLIELATEENTLLALEPISRMVPTTITKITASITAYSAMSCPCSSRQRLITLSLISIV